MKLTYHVSGWTDDVIQAIVATKPAIIKTLDPNTDILTKLKRAIPHLKVIYRRVESNQDIGDTVPTIRKSANNYAERVLNDLKDAKGLVWAVEGFNEALPESSSDEQQVAYDYWQSFFYDKITNQSNFEPIAFNFGTGNFPAPYNIGGMLKNFQRTLERYTLLGFHEYDWPTMYHTHLNDIAIGGNGMWLTLRYRRMRAALGKQYDYQRYIITECGMTQGVAGGEDIGWRANPSVEPRSYKKSLVWYNHQIEQDDYVLAACVFKTGGGTAMWDSFESTDMVRKLLK